MHDQSELLERFKGIRCFEQGGRYAPHKPLLLLMALAAVLRDGQEWLVYPEIENQLKALILEFGRPQTPARPYYPFWRLRSDGIWMVREAEELEQVITSAGDAPVTVLRAIRASGGFTTDVLKLLRSDPSFANELASVLLERAFPPSMHETVLDAIGFPWIVESRTRRDPNFREEILRIYERRCAVCGYTGRIGPVDIGIEAAHIKWYAADGPDTPENGLALCSFHHVAFDQGAIAIGDDYRVQVSSHFTGESELAKGLVRLAGRPMMGPQPGAPRPAFRYLGWQRAERFRSPARAPEV